MHSGTDTLAGGFPHSDIHRSQLGYQLPMTFRRFPRPSSPLDAKSSAMRPYWFDHPTGRRPSCEHRCSHSDRHRQGSLTPAPPQRLMAIGTSDPHLGDKPPRHGHQLTTLRLFTRFVAPPLHRNTENRFRPFGWGPLLVVLHLSKRRDLPGVRRSSPSWPRYGAEEILSGIKARSNCRINNSDKGLQISGRPPVLAPPQRVRAARPRARTVPPTGSGPADRAPGAWTGWPRRQNRWRAGTPDGPCPRVRCGQGPGRRRPAG